MRERRGIGTARAVLAAALTCAATTIGGCAAADPPAAPDVLVELVQLRGDVATGHVELRVTNGSDAPLAVVRATYESTRWAQPMTREESTEIPPGLRRNLRLLLPDPTCDAAPIEHLATLELADGTRIQQVPADPAGQLEALDDRVCDLRRFEQRVAALRWLEPRIPADGSGPAVLRLEAAPLAADVGVRGTIDAVDATVLLTPVDASGTRTEQLPVGLTLEPGGAATVVELPLAPGRCDLHAIAEDKQGTIFRLRATIDGEPLDLLLVSPDAQRDALLGWAVARCAAQP